MNKQKITIIALSVGLFALGQYVIYEKANESRQQELTNAYQSGYNTGLSDAVTAVYKQTENCHTTTLTIGNLTKTILDLSCVKSGQNNATR
jgi:hypothetical protein